MYFWTITCRMFLFFSIVAWQHELPSLFFMLKSRILVTLIEMLVVLLIISILLLLFVPNLSKQKDSVKETGNAAVVKVVDSQAELYEMKNNKTASLAALVSEGQITQKQADSYNDYYAKHGGESRSVAN